MMSEHEDEIVPCMRPMLAAGIPQLAAAGWSSSETPINVFLTRGNSPFAADLLCDEPAAPFMAAATSVVSGLSLDTCEYNVGPKQIEVNHIGTYRAG